MSIHIDAELIIREMGGEEVVIRKLTGSREQLVAWAADYNQAKGRMILGELGAGFKALCDFVARKPISKPKPRKRAQS